MPQLIKLEDQQVTRVQEEEHVKDNLRARRYPRKGHMEGCSVLDLFLIWNPLFISTSRKRMGKEYRDQKKKGLPWWRSGSESACQCREHGFQPWSGKIPHAAERQSPWATTTEPTRHNYLGSCAWSLCSATREATAMRGPCTAARSGPRSSQLEKARTQRRRPNTAKNK